MSNHRPALCTKLAGIDAFGAVALLFAAVVALGWLASSAEARVRAANSAIAPTIDCIDCKSRADLNVPGHHRCSLAYRPSIVTMAPRYSSLTVGGGAQGGLLPFEMRRQLADAWAPSVPPVVPSSVAFETFKSVYGKTRRMHA